uniref:Uncharacterized protein n=1 Tax=Arundo donax TaxID=35708 RepID=A0A0A8YCC9_ARUDO
MPLLFLLSTKLYQVESLYFLFTCLWHYRCLKSAGHFTSCA